MKWRRPLTVLLLCLLAAPADAVLLRYSFEEGETVRYRDRTAMAIVTDGPSGAEAKWQFRSESLLEQKVRDANGAFVIETETVENKSEVIDADGEKKTSEELGHPERVRLTPRGRVEKRETLGEEDSLGIGYTTKLNEFAIIQQVFDGLIFPEEEVEPGAEWTESIPVDLTSEDKDLRTPVTVEATTTFKRLVRIRDEECAELVTDFEIPLRTPKDDEAEALNLTIDGRILGHLTTYHSLSRGRSLVELATLGAVGEMTMSPPGIKKAKVGGRMKINIKTVLED